MDGFKNSTKTQYMRGGSCEGYAKGGSVKGAAKIAKVMGEFKAGTLHSGSKSGPEVTNPKQAVAISLSEARKAGAKVPMKKTEGGAVARGNRVSAEEAGEDKVIDRRRAQPTEPDYRRFRNYDNPEAKRAPSELSIRLTKRGPAGARHDDTPLLDRMVGAVRDTLGFAKGGPAKKGGGLSAMPRKK